LIIVHVETLISKGAFAESAEWRKITEAILEDIAHIDWPPGSGQFTIYPQSGKKRGEGNGVKPIKDGFMAALIKRGWNVQELARVSKGKKPPGDLDAAFDSRAGLVVLEWETGNISSSHRSLNKMAMMLLRKEIVAGILVVPSRRLYKWLTDRIGNFDELVPYFDLWRSIPCEHGILEIVVVEHDAESTEVPRIPKATDGRALE